MIVDNKKPENKYEISPEIKSFSGRKNIVVMKPDEFVKIFNELYNNKT